jgi:PII-like signaling protein
MNHGRSEHVRGVLVYSCDTGFGNANPMHTLERSPCISWRPDVMLVM